MLKFLTTKISRKKSDDVVARYSSEKRTLEIGSYGCPSYGRFFPNKVGIDIKNGSGVDIVASVYDIPFKDGEFDIVLCMSVLEHLEIPSRAISEMKRVLKPGGRVIVSVPFLFPIHDAPGDYWRFTKFGLESLFKDGWKIEKIIAETTLQESLAVLLQRIVYQGRFKFDKFLKLMLLSFAQILNRIPNMTVDTFGGIKKDVVEKDAFASAFFLTAIKD